MTADQIAAVTAIAGIIKQLGTWPFGSILILVIVGPWVASLLNSRGQEKRLEAVVKMYQDNVELVKDYQDLVNGFKRIVEGQQDLIIHTTQILTTVKEIAENNLYCPWVRKEAKPDKPIHG